MIIRKFDIVLISFPFSDLSRAKIRPALVVRALPGENVIVCQITTKERHIKDFEIPLKRSDCEGNVRFDSNAYVDMLFTLHRSLVKQKLGRVINATTCRQIDDKLDAIFESEQNRLSAA